MIINHGSLKLEQSSLLIKSLKGKKLYSSDLHRLKLLKINHKSRSSLKLPSNNSLDSSKTREFPDAINKIVKQIRLEIQKSQKEQIEIQTRKKQVFLARKRKMLGPLKTKKVDRVTNLIYQLQSQYNNERQLDQTIDQNESLSPQNRTVNPLKQQNMCKKNIFFRAHKSKSSSRKNSNQKSKFSFKGQFRSSQNSIIPTSRSVISSRNMQQQNSIRQNNFRNSPILSRYQNHYL